MSSTDTTHECPKSGCRRRVPVYQLACRPHWYLVPPELRSAVWASWANGLGAGTHEHNEALRQAIDAMNSVPA
jgi:hypothetical protein